MNRVIHFEIVADNPTRANDFYTKTFGWEIQKWSGPIDYWLAMTGDPKTPGIDGAIMPKKGAPSNVILTIGVSSFDESLKKVFANGGSEVTPKINIPGVGLFCYCKDTEGNIFGIMQDTSQIQAKPAPKKVSKKSKKSKTV